MRIGLRWWDEAVFKKPLVREGKEVTEGRDLYHFASSAFGDSTNRTEPEGNERSDLHSD